MQLPSRTYRHRISSAKSSDEDHQARPACGCSLGSQCCRIEHSNAWRFDIQSTSGFRAPRIILATCCALEGGSDGRDALNNTVSILGTKSRRRGERMDSEQATTAKHISSKHGAPSHSPKMQAFAFLVVFTALATSTVAISTTSRTATRVSNLIKRAAEYSNQCSHSTLCTGGLRHDCEDGIALIDPTQMYSDQSEFSTGHCYSESPRSSPARQPA
ncbi:hypothetical protein NUW54_g1312 [Trametes sanguinea]|uniref:Uncharacterized protein n=1 Tax=Trametes sanguinea TaxID=158606 RepID=A0ACC1QAH5_9APHY|nr:hypothetical protein NUW54_g1312 [Trametes sanguinea]